MGFSLSQTARGKYNSPASSTRSSESSSSVELVKTVLPFELKKDITVDVDDKDEDDEEEEFDPDDINVQDIEPKENTQSEQGGVEDDTDFVCAGCGNDRDTCHQYMFGG